MLSHLRKAPVAAMLLATTLLVGLPALADRVITIDSNGNVYDSFGDRIKHYDAVIVPGTSSYFVPATPAPSVVTVPTSAVITRTEPVGASVVRKVITTTTTTNTPVESTEIATEQFPQLLSEVLSTRASDLNRQLALIDESRALPLRTQLDQISEQVVALRPVLTFDEALSIAENLDIISNQMLMMAPVGELNPLVIVEPSGSRRIAGTNVEVF